MGQHTLIESKSYIGPDVVVGSHCIVDKACRIRESVVFDHSYVGSHSDLNRVIVDGRLVYQVEHDLATWIDDPSIVGSTRVDKRSVGIASRLMALLLLVIRAQSYDNPLYTLSFAVFGASLICLYLASTLYHSATDLKARSRLRIVDHATIFILIAGTYTPFCLITLSGPTGWTPISRA